MYFNIREVRRKKKSKFLLQSNPEQKQSTKVTFSYKCFYFYRLYCFCKALWLKSSINKTYYCKLSKNQAQAHPIVLVRLKKRKEMDLIIIKQPATDVILLQPSHTHSQSPACPGWVWMPHGESICWPPSSFCSITQQASATQRPWQIWHQTFCFVLIKDDIIQWDNFTLLKGRRDRNVFCF